MARSAYDILLEELNNHQKTLDQHAKRFGVMSGPEKMRTSGAAIYSLRSLLRQHKRAMLPAIIAHNLDYKLRFLSIMSRLYLVLDVMYVPNCRATLRQWAEETKQEAQEWLITHGWS
jgi:hypothetical protein